MKVAQRRGRGPERDIQREGKALYLSCHAYPFAILCVFASRIPLYRPDGCSLYSLVPSLSLPGCVVGIVSGSEPAQTEPGPAQRVAGI